MSTSMQKNRVHQYFLDLWYGNRPVPLALRVLAFVYRVLFACSRRRTQAKKPTMPVIVVGNITVGGTGKSPLVAYIAQLLQTQGLSVGVIMRGYKGTHTGTVVVTAEHSASKVGDEACMLRQVLNEDIVIVVDSNRARALAFIDMQLQCDVVISDDGLQNTRLWRDVTLVTLDGTRLFGNGQLLPAGPLRAPVATLAQADALLVSGTTDVAHDLPAEAAQTPRYRMTLTPTALVDVATNKHWSLADWQAMYKAHKLYALAAIGNPARFFTILRDYNFCFYEMPFADHYALTLADMPSDDQSVVIMTHKDAVKCTFVAEAGRYFYLHTELSILSENTKCAFDAFMVTVVVPHAASII